MTKPMYTNKAGTRAWIRGPWEAKEGADPDGKKVTIIVAKGEPKHQDKPK